MRRRPPTERPLGIRPMVFRFQTATGETERIPSLERQARIEAALFLAEEPLSPRELMKIAEITDLQTLRLEVDSLRKRLEADETPFQILDIAGGWQLQTRQRYHPWIVRLFQDTGQARLTPAALETLAIVAYRQPIMKAEIEKLRGVQVGEILNQLLERNFLRVAGRHDSLGRPVLYGTTKQFLQAFGLNALDDLPPIETK